MHGLSLHTHTHTDAAPLKDVRKEKGVESKRSQSVYCWDKGWGKRNLTDSERDVEFSKNKEWVTVALETEESDWIYGARNIGTRWGDACVCMCAWDRDQNKGERQRDTLTRGRNMMTTSEPLAAWVNTYIPSPSPPTSARLGCQFSDFTCLPRRVTI